MLVFCLWALEIFLSWLTSFTIIGICDEAIIEAHALGLINSFCGLPYQGFNLILLILGKTIPSLAKLGLAKLGTYAITTLALRAIFNK